MEKDELEELRSILLLDLIRMWGKFKADYKEIKSPRLTEQYISDVEFRLKQHIKDSGVKKNK